MVGPDLLPSGPARMRGAAFLLLVSVGLLGAAASQSPTPRPTPTPCPPPPDPARCPPWEIWRDLRLLARLDPDDRVVMRSSYCPEGCRSDRHGPDTPRFLRVDGDEGVIFEEAGAGAITRIWVTMGDGTSRPLDPAIRVRIRLDGQARPVVDLPLRDLFSGQSPPFVPPLVSDRSVSSGGYVSYVPIPYRAGCRLSLVNAADKVIWFQVTAHRVKERARASSFSGREDLSAWAALLDGGDPDPWRDLPLPVSSGTVAVSPGTSVHLTRLLGPDEVVGLLLRAPRPAWPELELRLSFDGERRVEMPLSDFFAVGRVEVPATRSLLVGAYDSGDLYCYFPMPLERDALLELRDTGKSGGEPVEVKWAVRTSGCPPLPGSARFGATLRATERTRVGQDADVLDLEGRGRWVGLFMEVGPAEGRSREYLEGDERVFVDSETEPSLHGTGVEDFFGGGFYFRLDQVTPVPFARPLHGFAYEMRPRDGPVVSGMYRLMLTDAIPFTSRLRVTLEGGPTNNLAMRLRTVAYYYLERGRSR